MEQPIISAPNEIIEADQEQEIYESGYSKTVIVDGVIYGPRSFYFSNNDQRF